MGEGERKRERKGVRESGEVIVLKGYVVESVVKGEYGCVV